MKAYVWILAVLLILCVLLGVQVLTLAKHPGSDCNGRVVIVRGPDGEPLECVCQAGILAACFKPGP
jgi:hypothetical protein